MFMCACVDIDAEISAVDAIAEDAVGDDDRAVVAGDVPLVQVRPRRRRARCPCRRGRARRTRSSRTRAARSGPATCGSCAPAAGPAGTSRERHLHLHPVMLGRRKREAIAHRRLRQRRCGRGEERQCGQRKARQNDHPPYHMARLVGPLKPSGECAKISVQTGESSCGPDEPEARDCRRDPAAGGCSAARSGRCRR